MFCCSEMTTLQLCTGWLFLYNYKNGCAQLKRTCLESSSSYSATKEESIPVILNMLSELHYYDCEMQNKVMQEEQTLMMPVSVPHKIMSLAESRLVILLPADNLPTLCCVPLNHI